MNYISKILFFVLFCFLSSRSEQHKGILWEHAVALAGSPIKE